MTAQEWLEELERLMKEATPGPWICEEGEGFDEDDVFISAEEREGMSDIAKIERGSPNAGMDEPFQSEQTANATYIVAACNALPRLIAMLRVLSEEASGEVTCLGSGRYLVNTPENMLQKAYKATEEACPKS